MCQLSGLPFSLSFVASKEQGSRLLECGHDCVAAPSSSGTGPKPNADKDHKVFTVEEALSDDEPIAGPATTGREATRQPRTKMTNLWTM